MGYDTRNPSFTFRFGEYRHGKLSKLAKLNKMPVVDFVRSKILDPFIEGDLVPKAKDDLILEMSKLKLEKIKAEIEYLKLKNRYMETFGTPLSSAATRILKPQIITMPQQTTTELMSPYDAKNNRLQCTDCGILFPWDNKDEFLQQKHEFELHSTNKHNRGLSYLEKSVLDDLSFSGASI